MCLVVSTLDRRHKTMGTQTTALRVVRYSTVTPRQIGSYRIGELLSLLTIKVPDNSMAAINDGLTCLYVGRGHVHAIVRAFSM